MKLRSFVFFFVWEDESLWAHWIRSFHMYLSFLGPNPISWLFTSLIPVHLWGGRCGGWCFFYPSPPHPQLLSSHRGGWWHLLALRHCIPFWEPSFTFGSQKSLMAVTFLAHWYGRKYFISHQISSQIPIIKQNSCPFHVKNPSYSRVAHKDPTECAEQVTG